MSDAAENQPNSEENEAGLEDESDLLPAAETADDGEADEYVEDEYIFVEGEEVEGGNEGQQGDASAEQGEQQDEDAVDGSEPEEDDPERAFFKRRKQVEEVDASAEAAVATGDDDPDQGESSRRRPLSSPKNSAPSTALGKPLGMKPVAAARGGGRGGGFVARGGRGGAGPVRPLGRGMAPFPPAGPGHPFPGPFPGAPYVAGPGMPHFAPPFGGPGMPGPHMPHGPPMGMRPPVGRGMGPPMDHGMVPPHRGPPHAAPFGRGQPGQHWHEPPMPYEFEPADQFGYERPDERIYGGRGGLGQFGGRPHVPPYSAPFDGMRRGPGPAYNQPDWEAPRGQFGPHYGGRDDAYGPPMRGLHNDFGGRDDASYGAGARTAYINPAFGQHDGAYPAAQRGAPHAGGPVHHGRTHAVGHVGAPYPTDAGRGRGVTSPRGGAVGGVRSPRGGGAAAGGRAAPESREIFVSGIGPGVSYTTLVAAFAAVGPIVTLDYTVGSGTARVTYRDAPTATTARRKLHRSTVGGSLITVSVPLKLK